MTLLITGTSSRACSKKREGTLASLISWAMANSDENVTHVFPHAVEEITQPVLIGLSSPTAPVSNYTYHGFATLSDAYDQGMLAGVFIDQPDPNSVANGCRTALSDYARLSSDFYSKRPGHGQYLEDDDFRKKVHRGMSLYLNEQLNLIVPAYPWANEKKIKKLVPEQHRLRLVDPSGAFDSLMSIISLSYPRSSVDASKVWARETSFSGRKLKSSDQTFPVITTKWSGKQQDFETYRASWGVVETDTSAPGWWTPTAIASLVFGSLFIGGKHTAERFMSPWFDQAESMTPDERSLHVSRQLSLLRRSTWSMEDLLSPIHGLIRSTRPSEKLDTPIA